MAAITITEEEVANAATYVALESKVEIAKIIAIFCSEPTTDEDGFVMYRENRKLRQMFLMGILAEMYLHREYKKQAVKTSDSEEPKEVRLLMDLDDYDAWASSHVMNQLERLKKDKTKKVSNYVYDLLYDYKAFENIIYGAIRDELERQNDPLRRAMISLKAAITPENVKALKETAEEITKQIGDAK